MPYPALRPVRRPSRHSLILPNVNNDVYEWDARSGILPPGFAAGFARSGSALGWVNGAYASFGTNVPRIEDLDYVGLAGRKGLLIEGARTNEIPTPDLSNAAWTKQGSGGGNAPTISSLPTGGVVGGQAYRVQFDAQTGNSQVFRGTVITNPTVCSLSVWMKANTGSPKVRLYTPDLTSAPASVLYTLDATWRKYSVAANAAANNGYVYLQCQSADGTPTADIVVSAEPGYGPQFEKAAFPSSPIPTAGSTATRTAETCPRSVVLPVGGFTEMFEFVCPVANPAGAGVKSIHGGALANSCRALIGSDLSLGVYVKLANVDAASIGLITTGGLVPGQRYRVAVRLQANNYKASVNGGAPVSGGGNGIFNAAALTTEELGTSIGGTQLFGSILRCNYSSTVWRPPVSDAQIQALSALT